MTLEELIAAAGDINRALDDRVHVWRIIVDTGPDGKPREIDRIYRGSFYQQRDSRIGEPQIQGDTHHE
jgi:hypothetical protein